jgi:hypothetical protein
MIGEAAWAVLAVCATATAICATVVAVWSSVLLTVTIRTGQRAVEQTGQALEAARWWKGQALDWKDEALRLMAEDDDDAAPADGPLAVVWRRER